MFCSTLRSQVDAGNPRLDHFRAGVTTAGRLDAEQLGIPVGSTTMVLVVDKKIFRSAGVEPAAGRAWYDCFKALRTIHDRAGAAGDAGCAGIMYLYDLYPRQNGKAFRTKRGLGFDEPDLTEWWQDGCNRVKAGYVTDPEIVAQEDRPKSSLSAGHGASESTWDNVAVRCSAQEASPCRTEGAERSPRPGRGRAGARA